MFSWPVFVASSVLVEIPWNILSGTIFFNIWYWTVGFLPASNRAGYAYLNYMLWQLYWCGFGQVIASFSPNSQIGSLIFSTLFSFVLIFCGVLQPYYAMGNFWRSWMYPLSPLTYLIEGLLSNQLSGLAISCTNEEFSILNPPIGQTCVGYLQAFVQSNGGYAQVLADGSCGYCSISQGDTYLASLNMFYSNRWRDTGIFCAFVGANYVGVFIATYLYLIVDWGKLFSHSIKPKGGAAGGTVLFKQHPAPDEVRLPMTNENGP
jgi:ATP-binding cassette subfamily G (WHITE) protein 2 (SNQ2)